MHENQNKRLNQKNMILNKAGLLFWEKGYNRTSMRDIARVCGCEPGNIYNYFNSKEQLLYEALRTATRQVVSAVVNQSEADIGTTPDEQLRSLVKLATVNALGIGRTSRLLPDVELRNLSPRHQKEIIKLRDSFDKGIRAVIRRGIESGDFAETDERLVNFAIAAIITRSRMWFSTGGRLSAEEIAEFFAGFVSNSLKYNLKKKRAKT
jgi:AcrR family transcriptional regulator